MGRIEVRLLGPFEVHVDGTPVPIPAGRAQALLAVLALSPGIPVPIERITDLVWGEDLPSNSRRTVQTNVKRLRAALGRESIGTDPGGYLFNIAADDVDALRFVRLLEAAGDRPATERAKIERALRLWRGSPLQGLDGCLLVEYERPRLVELCLTAVERRAELDLDAGRAGEVVAAVRDIAARYPLRETLWSLLIAALHRLGRSAEALECYETVRARIADQLGVDPGPDLQQQYAALLRGAPADEAAVSMVGSRGERSAGVQPGVPRQLPSTISGFVGRTGGLKALDEFVETHSDQSVSIVVLHGAGGMGKTALAVHWARRIADRFPDGQFFIDLRGADGGEPLAASEVLSSFLCALGVPERAVPVEVGERETLLRSLLAGRRVLMLLDNVRDATQVRPLLPGLGCLVLITSRSDLRGLSVREGARSLHVGEMHREEAKDLLSVIGGADRVTREPVAAEALMRLCGHQPLALRIIADLVARNPDTRLADLADDLRIRRLEVLADQQDDTADLRAVFSWSYRELRPADARLFRLLSLFPGRHFGVAAAAALADIAMADARRALDLLASLHLLETRALGRYEFHDLLRDYALERALAEETTPARDAALRRVLEWLCRMAMSASETFAPGRHLWNDPVSAADDFADQRRALDWFEHERPTVAAAVRVAQKSGADDLAWRLASSLLAYFVVRPVWDEFAPMYRNALASADRLGDPVAQAATLVGLGHVEMNMGRDDQALTFYREALTKFRAAGAARQQASVLTLIGNCLEYLGHHGEAESTFREALALSRETGDQAREAHALSNLAITCTSLGRYDEAVELSTRCLEIRQAQGDQRGQAHTLDNLGDAWIELGEYDRAIASFSDAAAIARTYSDPRNEGIYLGNLARAQLLAGAAEAANDTAEQARQLLAGAPDADADRVRRRIAESFPNRDR